jgi:hypothetical protein
MTPRGGDESMGFPAVKPRRRQKRTPSRDRDDARRLDARIDGTASERQQAWLTTGQPQVTERLSLVLDGMFETKRALRR